MIFQMRFWPLWSAFTLGAFADNMLRQALIIGISFGAISAGGPLSGDHAIPVIGSLFAVAIVCFSALAGQLADKYETSMLIRRTKFVELLVMILAAIGFGINNAGVLIIALFAMGAQSAFFSPVRIGAMPKYYAPEELIRANGLYNAGLFVAIVLGLLLGGVLIEQQAGGVKVSLVLAVAALFGFMCALRCPTASANASSLAINFNPIGESWQIIRTALRTPGLPHPLIGLAFFYYMSTFVTVLTPLYARDALNADASIANIIMATFAVGAGLGALGVTLIAKGRSGLGISAFGVSGGAITTLLVCAFTEPVAALNAKTITALFQSWQGGMLLACFMLTAACMGLFIVPLQAALQRRAQVNNRARMMAASNIANAFAAILGSLSVLLVTNTSVSSIQALLALAIIQGVVAIYMYMRKLIARDGLYDESLRKYAKHQDRGTRQ